jgi:hypothetical protein
MPFDARRRWHNCTAGDVDMMGFVVVRMESK